MPSGNKRYYILRQNCSLKLQVYLSMYYLLLPPGLKVNKQGRNETTPLSALFNNDLYR